MCALSEEVSSARADALLRLGSRFRHAGPKAFACDGTAAKKTNELLENATAAIDKLFDQRGYDPKKPEQP